MSRIKIVAIYLLLGPLVGGLVVAMNVLFLEQKSARFMAEFFATSLVFAFPFGALAALSAGLTHAFLEKYFRAKWLVLVVILSGIIGHIATVFLLGNPRGLFDSPVYFLQFALPAIMSALVISTFLIRMRKGLASAF